MDRLTIDEVIEHCKRTTAKYENLNGINTLETADISLSFIKEYWEHRQVKEYLEELKRYRDAEKQGLLLRLTCKVGDTVYAFLPSDNHFSECQINKIQVKPTIYGEMCYLIEPIGRRGHLYRYFEYDFGKTVFLTKAEAEHKLKEMESD